MKSKITNRCLSLLLTICLVAALIPASAFAQEVPQTAETIAATTAAAEEYVTAETADAEKNAGASEENDLAASNRNYYIIHFNGETETAYRVSCHGAQLTFTVYAKKGERGIYRDKKCTQKIEKIDIVGMDEDKYESDKPKAVVESILKWCVEDQTDLIYGNEGICEVEFVRDTTLNLVNEGYKQQVYDKEGKEILTTTYYDSKGRILSHTNHITGGTRTAKYDDYGNLLEEKTAEKYITSYKYEYKKNDSDKVVRSDMVEKTYPDYTTDLFTYNEDGTLASYTNRLGIKEEYGYDNEKRLIKIVTYDSDGKFWKEEVRNYKNEEAHFKYHSVKFNTLTTTYEDGRKSVQETLESENDAKKEVTTYDPDDEGNTKRRYTYNKDGYLTEALDPYGNTTYYEYDSKGNLTAVKTQADGSDEVVTNLAYKYEYDYAEDGTSYLKRIIKREGETVGEEKYADIYEYDKDGHLIKHTDPNGNETRYEYSDGIYLTKVIDPTKKETKYIYDKAGRLTKIENADGSRNIFEYDKDDRKVKEYLIADGVKVTREYAYDWKNRVRFVYDIDSSGNRTLISEYEYEYEYLWDVADDVTAYTDAKGNRTLYFYDARGNLQYEKDPMGNVTAYTYNRDGQVETVTDKNGTVTLVYDKAGNIISATDKRDNTTEFTYDYNNRQTSTSVKVGDKEIVTKFEYDVYGNVISITQPNGGVIKNTYDKSNQLTSTTDARGFTEYREYDKVGNLKKVTDRNENITEYSYDNFNRLIQVKDALGALNYTYDSKGRLTGAEAATNDGKAHISQGAVTYDALGRVKTYANALAKETDSKNKVTYEYDEKGRVSKETYEDGESYTAYTYDKHGNVHSKTYVSKGETYTYTYDYDTYNRLRAEHDPLGIKTEYDYTWSGLVQEQKISDKSGEILSWIKYTYDANENVESVKDLRGDAEIHYTYDERNLVKTITDERGNVYSYSYDESGNLREVVNPDNSKETYTYDENNNLKTSTICGKYTVYQYDRNGNVELVKFKNNLGEGENTVYYRYDARNRKTYERNSAGGVVSYTYDILNRVTQVKVSDNGGYYPGIVKMDEAITTYEYDAKGRVVKITDAEGHSRSFVYDEMDCVTQETDENGHTTRYAYDGLGNIVWVKDRLGHEQKYSYDFRGNCTGYTDAEGRTYTYEYDGLNRMISRADHEGNTRYYEYDSRGNVTKETDENGKVTTYTYKCDESGNVVEKKDELNNVTRISYDSMDRPTSVTQVSADGEERTLVAYTYNERGLVEKETDAQGNTKKYEYDDNGNLILKVDENENKTEYTYDNRLNLISSINYGNKKVTFAYDAAGNLRQMSDQTGTTTIGVDLLGRIKQVTNPSGDTVSYTYDNVGNLLKTEYSGDNGAEVNYEYDSENRLVSIKDSVAGKTALSYDNSGLLTEKTFENGEKQKYTYDKRGYISQLDEYTAEGQRYLTTYKYDPAGNRTDTVRYAYNSDTGILEQEKYEHYDYDYLNRISSSTDGTHSVNYEYDGFGNLIRESGDEGETIYSYNAMNQLVGKKGPDGKESYTYDRAGNRISMTTKDGTFRYYYDRENRLEEVRTPDGQYEKYVYNGLGMRTERISSEKNARQPLREEYVVDFTSGENNDLYVHVTGENDRYTKRYVYAQGERIAQVTDDPTGKIERLLYVHEDIMGSMSYMTGKDASLYERAEYKLWGEPEVSKDILKDKAVDIYFTGHPYDEMTGMYFAEARFYDPDTRSFISIDPAKDGVNWYQYCGANPATYWDPTGLSAIDEISDDVASIISSEGVTTITEEELASAIKETLKYPELAAKEVLKIGTVIATTIVAITMPISLPMVISGMAICSIDNAFEYILEQHANGDEVDKGQLLMEVAKGVVEGASMGIGGTELVDLAETARILKPLEMCAPKAGKVAQLAERWTIGTAGAFGMGVATEVLEDLADGKSLDESLSETFQNSGSILFNAALMAVSDVAVRAMRAPKCFTAGTLVLTEEGPVAIEEIQAGDKVLAFDEETGEIAYKEVVQTFENTTDELTYVTVETEDGETETIESTPGHLYYVEKEKGFVKAYLLEEGTVLALADGRTAYVKEVVTEELSEPVKVYNFEVADLHTYYVGENSVLVHNMQALQCNRGVGTIACNPLETSRQRIREVHRAHDFVKSFGIVDYNGLSPQDAKRINNALNDVYSNFDLPKLNSIQVVEKSGTDSVRASIDRDTLDLKLVKKYMDNNGELITKRYEDGLKKIAKLREEGNKVIVDRLNVSNNLAGTIYHEMGHVMHYKLRAEKNNEHIDDKVYQNMGIFAKKISGYALTDFDEYIAESFASYMKGEDRIDPILRKIFDEQKKGNYCFCNIM